LYSCARGTAASSRSVSFTPRLALDGCQRPLRHVVAKLAADSHTARLGRVLELTMATCCNHQGPAMVLQHPNNFTNLHPVTLSNAQSSTPIRCRRTPTVSGARSASAPACG